jgi:hypothetical protein
VFNTITKASRQKITMSSKIAYFFCVTLVFFCLFDTHLFPDASQSFCYGFLWGTLALVILAFSKSLSQPILHRKKVTAFDCSVPFVYIVAWILYIVLQGYFVHVEPLKRDYLLYVFKLKWTFSKRGFS